MPVEEKPDWEVAVDYCDELIDLAGSVPDRSANFGADVQENIEGMRKWIAKNKRVTSKQLIALENWETALYRCINT